jgi:putative DNA primase/helicase
LLLDMASRITRGAKWPDDGCAAVGSVIVLTAEDGLADTVRPRVDIQGGDASRIHVLQALRSGQEERPFSLVSDLLHLESAIKTVRDVQLIIIDPLSAYLGDKNSYKDAEIRTLLTPLAALAERYGVALVGILHLTKDEQRKALYRAQGTIAFVAAARTVFAVGKDTKNPDRRIFVCVKNNLAAHPPALAFSIVEEAGRGRLEWESEPIKGVDADSVLSMSLTLAEREDCQNVDKFLRKLLDSGPVASTKVYQDARQNGFSESTVNRAKRRLGIDAMKTGQPGETDQKWYRVLPKIVTKSNQKQMTQYVRRRSSRK